MSLLFLILPPDLHRCIGLLCPEMVPRLSQTCSCLYRNLSPIYNQCSHKIRFKRKEVNDYWENREYTNFADFNSTTHYSVTYSIGLSTTGIGVCNFYGYLSVCAYSSGWISYDYGSPDRLDRLDRLDMKTTRYFLLKRLGCIKRNPCYVREKSLADLDRYYRSSRDMSSSFDLFSLYIYLYVNMLVIGNDHTPRYMLKTKMYDSDEIALLKPIIKEECLYLYETLRSHYSKY